MYNIIVEDNIPTLYRADSRDPETIRYVGGFAMSRSIDTDGTLGRYENGRAIDPIIYTAQTYIGMKDFVEKMPGERYYYQIDSLGLPVARYRRNVEDRVAKRNLTLHLKKQSVLMSKIIGPDWASYDDSTLIRLLYLGDANKDIYPWYGLTTDAEECHIIGKPEQRQADALYYTNDPQPIIVPLQRITYIGRKSSSERIPPKRLG